MCPTTTYSREDRPIQEKTAHFTQEQISVALTRYPILSQSMLAAVVNAPQESLLHAREALLQQHCIVALPPPPGRRSSYRYLLERYHTVLQPFYDPLYQRDNTLLGMVVGRLRLYPLLSPSLLLIALTNVPRFLIEDALREGKEQQIIAERSAWQDKRTATRYYLREYEPLLLPLFLQEKTAIISSEGSPHV